MKVYKTNEIKNIAILGGSGTGKTTFAEAILFESGLISEIPSGVKSALGL